VVLDLFRVSSFGFRVCRPRQAKLALFSRGTLVFGLKTGQIGFVWRTGHTAGVPPVPADGLAPAPADGDSAGDDVALRLSDVHLDSPNMLLIYHTTPQHGVKPKTAQ
jgi:hypothetical protein